MKNKMTACKACGKEIAKSAKTCPHCGAKNKKPLFKKWWFWVIVVLLLGSIGNSGNDIENGSTVDRGTQVEETTPGYCTYSNISGEGVASPPSSGSSSSW